MKKLIKGVSAIAVLALLGLVMVGCASSPQSSGSGSTPQATHDPTLPAWIDDLPPEDVLWGIGAAKQSSMSMSRTTARNRAVVDIARQIDSRVKAMFTDYNRDAGTTSSQANLSLQEDVSRTLTDVDLSGTETNANWTAPDGTYWIRVSYPKANLLKTAEQIFDSEAARYAEFKADQALAIMENELSRSERPQGVRE
ncbi:MAG: LPP20 family lipoprotein [Treponema sp.]|nr:LPP20 family lipoprotein [Treponema sp.]